jgi:excisionase family DNA binding protein
MLIEPPYSVAQAARALNLSVACIRAWVLQRRIAYLKLGRSIRIPASEIRRLLEDPITPSHKQRA